MIHEFSGKKRLFFPVSWANSVARWMTGIHSPSGTVKIGNTVNPGEEKGVTIDVDIDAVSEKVKTINDAKGFDTSFITRIRDLICMFLDGQALVWKGGRATVNEEWLAEHVETGIEKDETAPVFNDDTQTNGAYDFKRSSNGNTSDFTTYAPSASRDAAFWTRDTTTKGGESPCGVRMQAVSRIQRAGVYDLLYWRWMTFDANGMLKNVSAEQGCFVIVNANGYSGV